MMLSHQTAAETQSTAISDGNEVKATPTVAASSATKSFSSVALAATWSRVESSSSAVPP
ncbi:hypothetical protein BKA80DRAFT_275006 [Phyllosticta citrichinensis]